MKIYYVIVSLNEYGKVTCGQLPDGKIVHPYLWDRKLRCYVNMTACLIPSQIRYLMKKSATRFDWF